MPFDYFFKEEHKEIHFLFRADKPKEQSDTLNFEHFETHIIHYLDVMGDEDFHYLPPKYTVRTTDKEELKDAIRKIAWDQRVCAKIDYVVPDNYYEVVQNMGINVIVKDLKNNACFGASSISEEYGSYILINDSDAITEERKIFSLFHEYAHLLFHSHQYNNQEYDAYYKNGRSNPEEKIANQFAGYFLMPLPMVDEYLQSRDGKKIDVMEMKKYFKVSLQTLAVILHEYGYISEQKYKEFWQHTKKADEPSPLGKINLQEKNRKLIEKIKHLYLQDDISANKISEVLGIDAMMTRNLLKEWRNMDERYLPFK